MIEPEPVIAAVCRLAGAEARGNGYAGENCVSDLRVISEAPDGTPLGVVVRAS